MLRAYSADSLYLQKCQLLSHSQKDPVAFLTVFFNTCSVFGLGTKVMKWYLGDDVGCQVVWRRKMQNTKIYNTRREEHHSSCGKIACSRNANRCRLYSNRCSKCISLSFTTLIKGGVVAAQYRDYIIPNLWRSDRACALMERRTFAVTVWGWSCCCSANGRWILNWCVMGDSSPGAAAH